MSSQKIKGSSSESNPKSLDPSLLLLRRRKGLSREFSQERWCEVPSPGVALPKPKKVAGQRNESCAGLLFPPEQGANLYLLHSNLKRNFSELSFDFRYAE
jgi:hypothetical protein